MECCVLEKKKIYHVFFALSPQLYSIFAIFLEPPQKPSIILIKSPEFSFFVDCLLGHPSGIVPKVKLNFR